MTCLGREAPSPVTPRDEGEGDAVAGGGAAVGAALADTGQRGGVVPGRVGSGIAAAGQSLHDPSRDPPREDVQLRKALIQLALRWERVKRFGPPILCWILFSVVVATPWVLLFYAYSRNWTFARKIKLGDHVHPLIALYLVISPFWLSPTLAVVNHTLITLRTVEGRPQWVRFQWSDFKLSDVRVSIASFGQWVHWRSRTKTFAAAKILSAALHSGFISQGLKSYDQTH